MPKELLTPSLPLALETLSQKEILCAEVAVALPLENTYTYSIPENLAEQAAAGKRVLIGFKNREMTGYLVRVEKKAIAFKLKPLLKILDENPVLTPSILALTEWMADFYACSWGEAIENALPKWVRYGKKAEKALSKKTEAIPLSAEEIPKDFTLTAEQESVLEKINLGLRNKKAKPLLIQGVTGSGKSEIYIRAIREVLKQGKSAICLVPEIALTEQIRRFFLHHFGQGLEILHSKLSDTERFLAWKRIEGGEKNVMLGPRSAIFAPVPKLGLVIMDEEHEGTYKQETTPRYHAREVAAWRAAHEGALFIMGTATPSLETMRRVQERTVDVIELKERVDKKAMPEVHILDLKSISQDRKKPIILSHKLCVEIESNLKKGEGTMLLLNRRGFSTQIHCPKCGQMESCPSCQVSLIYHQEDDFLLCHYCNFRKPVPEICTNCKTPNLRFSGFGTEKIESEVAARFPNARVARMDADSVKKRGSHEVILKDFREQKIDILIGTQMIAKGFDFPHVTLVGVILADVGLMLPDFRSAERTFQLLTQVAGRAGRGKLPGRVYIQTFSPEHPSVLFAKKHDVASFYEHEIPSRYEFRYPPYCRLINIIIRSKVENKAYLLGREIREALEKTLSPETSPTDQKIEIIGPAPLPFYKLRGHFRWHVMLKLPLHENLAKKVKTALSSLKKSPGSQYTIDVDPLNIL